MAEKEAREHIVQAEKALATSAWTLKFKPDHLTASLEYSQAATKFRAANLTAESVNAWLKAAELKEILNDVFGAGRAYESAGGLCTGEAAAGHWEKAVKCFRLSGKSEIAVKLLLKLAELYEKQGDAAKARVQYEDSIDVYTQDEKDYNLGDVYKQYIGFTVRTGQYEDALKAIDGHAALLTRAKQFSFVHKEILSKIVLLIHMEDTVRADEALGRGMEIEGFCQSKEFQVGSELVQAYQENDAEAAARLLKEQTFTFLHVEVARIAMRLRIPMAAVPTGGGDGGGEEAGLGASLM
eukprot:gnl/TRDRNA2_/TRDRNA2_187997_c0_seq1.p1 gnl/TRDRNA2_/TRDRNA2_187997_c0~~gnl/TRDRNA2_/TRDRNA2_187997_c0_seq1.p1  ORF type:complete len:296 (+),score=84.86 gnl/TRDRNA2_/TRDRNA2_187997_c0_seq1:77-964(+)